MPIKVAITDDHIMVLRGLQLILAGNPDIMLSGIFQTGKELLHAVRTNMPDILLLDLQLKDTTGQELALQLLKTYPALKIIIITGVESPLVVQDMMKAGCKGYLLKNTADKEVLTEAIQRVYNGDLYLEPAIQQQLLQNVLDSKPITLNSNKKLTTREKEVLRLVAMEYTNHQIADMLFISLRTVENHRYNLLQKLEVRNAIGLVKAAIDLGLLR